MSALQTIQNQHLVKRFEKVKPPSMQWQAELGFVQQLLKASDYLMKMADQNPESLAHAVANVAAIGLTLNPAEGLAYLVPRKGRICLDPSYRGLVKLATDTGHIEWVQAKCVFENDHYENTGVDTKPVHTFNAFADRGEFVGCYCTARTRGGAYLTEEMTAAEITMIRDKSSEAHKGGKGSPWDDWLGEMAKKTVVRRASKLWPRSLDPDRDTRMYKAIDISNENEGLELVKSNPVGSGQYSDETKSYFDQMIAANDAAGMVVFNETTDPIDFQALYHSFEDRTKGKNQRVVDGLMKSGYAMVAEYGEQVTEYVTDNFDLAELLADIGPLYGLVKQQVSNEAALAMEQAK